MLLLLTQLFRDRVAKEEQNRQDEEAKSTHAQLLQALCDAAAANDKHVQSLKEAIAGNDMSRAEVAVQALRSSAEAIFVAGGGRNFGKVLKGLVQFMKKHAKSVFGKQIVAGVLRADVRRAIKLQ
jgi:phage tail sheath protein FI